MLNFCVYGENFDLKTVLGERSDTFRDSEPERRLFTALDVSHVCLICCIFKVAFYSLFGS